MLMFRATGLIIGLCFFAFLTWFNVDTLREHFGSGPPYFSRTTNMDKWTDPRPGLVMIDVPALLMTGVAIRLFTRRRAERLALESVPEPDAEGPEGLEDQDEPEGDDAPQR